MHNYMHFFHTNKEVNYFEKYYDENNNCLEECPKEKLNERERYWIDFYNSISYGYNTSIGG